MPKEKVAGLISDLHEKFANSDTSPEQEALLLQLESQLEEWEGPKPDGNLMVNTELLLSELEEKHPKAAAVVREILETLAEIGI